MSFITDSMSGSISIRLNGEPANVNDQSTLGDLIADLELVPQRIAVELNREVVKRGHWSEIRLNDGDIVEIVHFVGGGLY